MRIIDQSHEIKHYPKNLLQDLEEAGRTCYKSEDKITSTSAAGFVSRIIKAGHHAMIEFGDITVRFVTNRGVTHELVRHRLCSFAQESTRYVSYDEGMEFVRPVWIDNCEASPARTTWLYHCHASETKYKQLIDYGWKAEEAREVLPNSLKSEILMKGNIREWRHIFKLRCANGAHPQMRALMRPLLKECQELMPVVFDDITY
jgi:thymidylate synthase (FAD)